MSEELGRNRGGTFFAEDFCIRPWRPGDEAAILDAFNRAFPTRRTLPEWRWIYRDSPDGAEIMLCLAPNGEVAAHYAATIHRALYGEVEVRVGMMRDTFTLPAYRGVLCGRRALISTTYDAFVSMWTGPGRMLMGYGFPNHRHYRLGRLSMQYRPFSVWWRGQCRLVSERKTAVHRPASSPLTIREVTCFDNAFDRLWARDIARYRFTLIRDSRYLNWRFVDAPHRSYWRFACFSFLRPELQGYLIFHPHNESAFLVDFHLPSQPEAARSFWREVSARLWARGIRRIEGWCAAATPDVSALLELGFTPLPRDEQLCPVYRSFDPQLDPDWAENHFHFTMGDSDLV
ncbi:MAG: hypothetical protein V1782_00865 [Pseudomonadota bacterium]